MKTLAHWLTSALIAWAVIVAGCRALGITVDGKLHTPVGHQEGRR